MFIRGGIVKRILLLLIAVLVMAGCNGGSGESSESSASRDRDDNCVYNNFYWGDDKEYVIAEKGEPESYNPDNSIEYNENFRIDDCSTVYYFDEDWKLYKIKVRVVDSLLGDDMDAIKNMLVEMYGDPLSEETDDAEEYAFTTYKWERGNTNIGLNMTTDLMGCYSVDYSKK